ncbi:MAG: YeeE/YedE family protein [Deltaproteobacteria bacterium]|nr:YeeE/YedE family protein [Deltaproteobacteria bacterium]
MPYEVIFLAGTCLIIGFSAGFIMHRSDYCMAGMFRDLFLFRATFMLRTLMLLIVSAMVLFEGARFLNLLPFYPFPLLGSLSFSNIIGGFLFGLGMVLAGGCVVGTLYKMGAGSLLSLTAFSGLIIGSGLYAEIHPSWSVFARNTALFPGIVTLPQLIGCDPYVIVLPTVIVSMFFFWKWHQRGLWLRQAYADGYLQPWRAATGLALINLCSYCIVGMPMEITTTYAKIAGFFERFLWPQHFAALVYFQGQPLNVRLSRFDLQLVGGGAPGLDAIAYIQGPVIVGIILGSLFSAIRLGEFSLRWRLPLRQYGSVLVGGIIMGLASRMAPGCNVWHLLGGLPILALQSFFFLAGLLPGAWFGARLLAGFILRT